MRTVRHETVTDRLKREFRTLCLFAATWPVLLEAIGLCIIRQG